MDAPSSSSDAPASSSSTSPSTRILPSLSSLPPSHTHPPSSYPPPSFFESELRSHPALIIPAKRTGEIRKRLDELVHKEAKRKSVLEPELGLDYMEEDLKEGGYDPRWERKLVLVSQDVGNGDGDHFALWENPRVASLLSEERGDDDAKRTAPKGKRSARKSSTTLPATPYALLTVDQVLRRLMPTAPDGSGNDVGNGDDEPNRGDADDDSGLVEEVPSSFEIAGHVAHVNLRSESLPYKYLVGRAILDKNQPRIRVVVNKVGNIENEYRTFPMEILAGEGMNSSEELEEVERMCKEAKSPEECRVMITDSKEHAKLMEVEVREHGCRFKLDFAKVYFNSRLQGEHDRIVQEIVRDARKRKKNESGRATIVADAMAGVGPFAVPLTAANAPHFQDIEIVCHANDLNPISYKYLKINSRVNSCPPDRLKMYNLCAREFVRKMNEEGVDVDHFIMNLPASAPEFLDAYRGWKFRKEEGGSGGERGRRRPMVHVHCFGEKARPGDADSTARVSSSVRERCEASLGCPVDEKGDEFRVKVVRDVGPRKNMLCASFLLPWGLEEVKLSEDSSGSNGEGVNGEKRPRDEGGPKDDDGEAAETSNSSKKSRDA